MSCPCCPPTNSFDSRNSSSRHHYGLSVFQTSRNLVLKVHRRLLSLRRQPAFLSEDSLEASANAVHPILIRYRVDQDIDRTLDHFQAGSPTSSPLAAPSLRLQLPVNPHLLALVRLGIDMATDCNTPQPPRSNSIVCCSRCSWKAAARRALSEGRPAPPHPEARRPLYPHSWLTDRPEQHDKEQEDSDDEVPLDEIPLPPGLPPVYREPQPLCFPIFVLLTIIFGAGAILYYYFIGKK